MSDMKPADAVAPKDKPKAMPTAGQIITAYHTFGTARLDGFAAAVRDLWRRAQATASVEPCQGTNCGSTDGKTHSPECQAEHEASVGGYRKPKAQAPSAEALAELVAAKKAFDSTRYREDLRPAALRLDKAWEAAESALVALSSGQAASAVPEGRKTFDGIALSWAVDRWIAEVKGRPLVNKHRRTLDDTWRQVMRHFGGDPDQLVGPSHDALLAASPTQPASAPAREGVKLWLWKNGDHFLAFKHLHPCFEPGGDPMTLGEPSGYAIFCESCDRSVDKSSEMQGSSVDKTTNLQGLTLDDAAHALLAILERAGEGATVADVLAKLNAFATPTAPAQPREAQAQAADLHPATADLVARFSKALAEKLAAAEKKYGYSDGWASPDWMDECRQHLREHIEKGDPRDVAAYCAFLWHHGASTANPGPKVPTDEALLALVPWEIDTSDATEEAIDRRLVLKFARSVLALSTPSPEARETAEPIGFITEEALRLLRDPEWLAQRGTYANLWGTDGPPNRAIVPVFAAPVSQPEALPLKSMNWHPGPIKTEWGDGMLVADVELSPDQTLTMFIHKNALPLLKDKP